MNPVRALVPIKNLAEPKTRLAPALSQAERSALARHMADDVLTALRGCAGIDQVVLLGDEADTDELARRFSLRIIGETPGAGLSGNLQAAAGTMAAEGAQTLLILPTDLPTLTSADISALVVALQPGITVVPARLDGGTNALAMNPAGAGECLFGPDSARRHLESARRRGIPAHSLELTAFARDVDTVDDVLWLCRQDARSKARDYLHHSGICERLQHRPPE